MAKLACDYICMLTALIGNLFLVSYLEFVIKSDSAPL